MAAAFVFPGQGSQSVGMGRALSEAFPAARLVFEEVDDALGEHLSAVIWEGPSERLTLTENAQPALMAVSLAAMRVLKAEAGIDLARDAAYVAGHSLGEYSALAAAGSLSIADSARLLRIRGRAMQKAVPVGQGAMAALLGLEFEVAQAVAAEGAQGAVCQAANDNGAGQVVVSGDKAAVERAVELAKAAGAKRAMLLPVSAPFHCALMAPAAEAMAVGTGGGEDKPAGRAAGGQRARLGHHRSGRDRALPRRPGHRHRALARMRLLHGGPWRHRVLRGRRRQGAQRPRSSASPTARREPRSARRKTSGRSRRPARGRGASRAVARMKSGDARPAFRCAPCGLRATRFVTSIT